MCDKILCCFGFLTCFGCRNIVCRKLVFFPPPSMYAFENSDNNSKLSPHIELMEGRQTMWLLDMDGNKILPYDAPNFNGFLIPTKNGENIAAYFIRQEKSKFTLLFSHGNATDIGYSRDNLVDISNSLNVNLFAYDYSGYGLSTGQPGISNVEADVEAAYDFLTMSLHIDPKTIVVYGQSLGSGPTTHIAMNREVAGIVLHSAFMSGLRVIRPVPTTYFFDIFANIDNVTALHKPLFIIHGTHDTEIPVEHGVKLFEASEKLYDAWFVDGGGHNDIEINFRGEYITRLHLFLQFLDSRAPKKV